MCAYAPNVAPDSTGIANGITNASNAIAQGYNEMKQNQLLASTATAKFEGALQSSPELLQVLTSENAPSNLSSAYNKLKTGGQVGLKDAALLSTFADSFQQEKSKRQQQQMQTLQLQQAQQAQTQQDQANQKASALAQFASGNGVSMMTPQAQEAMKSQLSNPVGQYIAQVYNYTGRAPSQEALTEFAKSAALMTGKRNPAYDLHSVRSVDPATGKPIEKTVDQISGQTIDQGPLNEVKYVLSPEDQAKAAGLTETAKTNAQRAAEFVQSVPDAAEAAQANLPQIAQIEKLYREGTSSGFGQDFLTKGAALAYRLGIGDAKSQADKEQLQKLLAAQALTTSAQLMKGQGAVSNFERTMVTDAGASLDKSPQANLRIIQLTKAIAQRNIDLEKKRQDFMDSGVPDVAESLRRWRSNNPLQSYVDKSEETDKHVSAAEDILKKYNVTR